jgi:hypothetical protein
MPEPHSLSSFCCCHPPWHLTACPAWQRPRTGAPACSP